MKNIKWFYRIDRKKFTTTASNLNCKNLILTAKLNNSPFWFIPFDRTSITFTCFLNKIRKLAKEHNASSVTVTTLDKINTDIVIRFEKRSTDWINRKATDWKWAFVMTNISNPLKSYFIKENKVFFIQSKPNLAAKEGENNDT